MHYFFLTYVELAPSLRDPSADRCFGRSAPILTYASTSAPLPPVLRQMVFDQIFKNCQYPSPVASIRKNWLDVGMATIYNSYAQCNNLQQFSASPKQLPKAD